jgi:hypothetical protein
MGIKSMMKFPYDFLLDDIRVLFLDTNVFLQCLDLSQIHWDDISKNNDLLLLISKPVLDDIDRFKHGGNARRATRARKATSFFRTILESKTPIFNVRESAPKVDITFAPPVTLSEKDFESLDFSRPDDRIIAEALDFKLNYKAGSVALLTHDTNPILTAKLCSLEYVLVPDNWILPPEPDMRDKELTELRNRVKELKKIIL